MVPFSLAPWFIWAMSRGVVRWPMPPMKWTGALGSPRFWRTRAMFQTV